MTSLAVPPSKGPTIKKRLKDQRAQRAAKRPSFSELQRLYRTDPRFNPLLLDSMASLTFDFEPYLPAVCKEQTFEMMLKSYFAPTIYDAAVDGVLPPPPPQSLVRKRSSTPEKDLEKGSVGSDSTASTKKRLVNGREPIVCRYFLMGRCMKGSKCEWSHKMDEARMDWCKFGTECARRPHCPFLHIDQMKNVKDCEAYETGFCPHGPVCKQRHVPRLPSELPRVAKAVLEDIAMWGQRAQEDERRKAYHKTSICRAWKEGACRRGAKCTFAHGYLDLSAKGVERLEGRVWYTDPSSKEKLYLDGHGAWWKRRGDGSKKLEKIQ